MEQERNALLGTMVRKQQLSIAAPKESQESMLRGVLALDSIISDREGAARGKVRIEAS